MLLDEPFSALDRELRAQLCHARARARRPSSACPIVHVTHSVAEARLLADRVVRIARGRVVAVGAPADVLAEVAELE